MNRLAGEYLANEAGVKLQHVPYKGNGPAMGDLLGGHIPMMFLPVPVAVGNIKAGTLLGLAITSATRSSLLPDLPTLAVSEDVKSRLATEGAEALPGTPEAYAADIDADEKKWGGLVKKLGLKVE